MKELYRKIEVFERATQCQCGGMLLKRVGGFILKKGNGDEDEADFECEKCKVLTRLPMPKWPAQVYRYVEPEWHD